VIDIKGYIMDDFKKRVDIISQIKKIMQDLCNDTTQNDVKITKGKYENTFNFTVKYQEYEISDNITIQEIHDHFLEHSDAQTIDYAIYDSIINKVYPKLRKDLDIAKKESLKNFLNS